MINIMLHGKEDKIHMHSSFICPESATCDMQPICNELITLEVHKQFVLWQKDFANTMIRHYHDHDVSYRIHRNCVYPDWQTMKSTQGIKMSFGGIQMKRKTRLN